MICISTTYHLWQIHRHRREGFADTAAECCLDLGADAKGDKSLRRRPLVSSGRLGRAHVAVVAVDSDL